MSAAGPHTPFSEQLHAQKYRTEGESFRDCCNRVASALNTDGDDGFFRLREVLLDQRFVPGGRIQAAVGAPRRTTPYNCFVSGTIEDSFVDGQGSIMQRALEAAATMRMGGGIGYDFSTLRPRGATIRKLGSRSSGPIAFMEIYDAVCRATASSGHRRGAQMGMLRVDHPDIEAFVHAKQNRDKLTGFNVSIAVTDEFMNALRAKKPFKLRWGGQEWAEVDPVVLWEAIMRSTWDWAEPGVIFIDRVNTMNNLWYCETIAATNPCGEQPLPPHGACLLGSFNLVRYLKTDVATGDLTFDFEQLRKDVPVVVAAMDRVVDVATYPLYEQEKEAQSKRRMGLGVMGLANALEAMGNPYGSESFVNAQVGIMEALRDAAYLASADLAQRRGPFPLFERDKYMAGQFVGTLPDHVRDAVAKNGIRNSHLLSIAPTGTISLCADNVSSGIEPVFDYEVDRTLVTFEGPQVHRVADYGLSVLGVRGVVAADVKPSEHLAVLAAATQCVDSAVSKTCNVPESTSWEEFKSLYVSAWVLGCKGCTTYQVGGKRAPVLEGVACRIDEKTGRRECD